MFCIIAYLLHKSIIVLLLFFCWCKDSYLLLLSLLSLLSLSSLSFLHHFAAKPAEADDIEYDLTDPDNLYFVYICKKSKEMNKKKQVKEGRLAAKELESNAPRRRRAPNLK